MSERRLRVLVEKNREHRLTPEEEAALKVLSGSENFYSLGFNKEQVTQFWDWYNQQVKGKKQGRIRAACKIYKFRPEICRTFHCGKNSEDEPLLYRRYKYELTSQFMQDLEKSRKKFSDAEWEKLQEMIRQEEQQT